MKLQKNKTGKEVQEVKTTDERTMTRKQAIKKAGYIALSAATMMILLSKPENSQAVSPSSMPIW